MAQITIFALDSNWDLNPAVVLSDYDAVAQIIKQRLQLLMGEWWEATNQGLPLWQTILNAGSNPQAAAMVIEQCIAGTPYVTSLIDVNWTYNGETRQFAFSCGAVTAFGTIPVTYPTPPSQGVQS